MAPRKWYRTDRERIERNIEIDAAGCWMWQSTLHELGYGLINDWNSRRWKAHRLSYHLFVGPIPEGMVLDHLCRRRACVNPAHLEPVTQAENTRRSPFTASSVNAAKTHCYKGHPFDEANTRIAARGERVCRTCRREWDAARQSARG